MNTSLIWITPDAERMVAHIARVSNPANQDNPDYEKLLRYMIEHKHWSPFEMASACVEINTTRDIGRQVLRHRSFSFQEFCVAEGTLVTTVGAAGRTKKIPIEKLFAYQFDKRMDVVWDRGVRVFDEDTKTFVRSRIKEVFDTGMKECFEVRLSDGKVLTCTDQHKFFTRTGFAKLGDLSVGDLVAVNGVAAYQSAEWMADAKAAALAEAGRGVAYIAALANCSYHTIRKWLKVHGLQFTKKENAIVQGGVWNKGLPKEQQPNFGNSHNAETRAKMKASSRQGADSELFIHGNPVPFRTQVWHFNAKWKNAIFKRDGEFCHTCGATNDLQIDHIKPVSSHPELAFETDNLQVLCCDCHKVKSTAESVAARQTVRWKEVVSITPVGLRQTYDMEVDHPSHNYVANGVVTHNSQRYAAVDALPELREARLQDTKNRQNSFDVGPGPLADRWEILQHEVYAAAEERYREALALGIAKEQARALLPEGLTPTRMYMAGTLRSFLHFLQVRLDPATQKEHRLIAQQIAEVLRAEVPTILKAAGL